MLKTYTIKVVIQEGSDEFWESLEGKSGCDEVVQTVRECLEDNGFSAGTGCVVSLERFEEARLIEGQ